MSARGERAPSDTPRGRWEGGVSSRQRVIGLEGRRPGAAEDGRALLIAFGDLDHGQAKILSAKGLRTRPKVVRPSAPCPRRNAQIQKGRNYRKNPPKKAP